jgi:hypothetical protein
MGLVDLLSDLSNFIWTNYADVPGGSDVGGQSATIKMANSVKIANLPTHVIIDADGNFSWGTESTILAPNPFADGGVEFWIPESDMEYSDRYVERVKRIEFDPETSQYNVEYSPMDGIDPDTGEPYPLPRFRDLSDDEIIEQFGTVEVEIEGVMVEQPNTGGYEEWLEYMDNAGLKEQSPIRIRSEGERNLELLMSRIVEQPGVLNNIPYEVEEGLVGSWFDINWSDDVFDFDSTDLTIPPGSSYTDILGSDWDTVDGIIQGQAFDTESLPYYSKVKLQHPLNYFQIEPWLSGFPNRPSDKFYIGSSLATEGTYGTFNIFTQGSAGLGRVNMDSPNFPTEGTEPFNYISGSIPYAIPKQYNMEGEYEILGRAFGDPYPDPNGPGYIPYYIGTYEEDKGPTIPTVPLKFANLGQVPTLESNFVSGRSNYSSTPTGPPWSLTDIFGHAYTTITSLTSNILNIGSWSSAGGSHDGEDGWAYHSGSTYFEALGVGAPTSSLESYYSKLQPDSIVGSFQASDGTINIPNLVSDPFRTWNIPKQHEIAGNYTMSISSYDSTQNYGVQTPAGLPLLFGNLNVSQLESRLSSSFLPSSEGDWTDPFGHNYSALSTLTSNISQSYGLGQAYIDGWNYNLDLPYFGKGLETYHSNLMPIEEFTSSFQTGTAFNIPTLVKLYDSSGTVVTASGHFRSWVTPKPYNMTGQYTMSISSKYGDLTASTPASDIIYFGNLSPVTSVDDLSGNAFSRYTGSNASFIPINQGDWKDPFGHSYEAKDTLTSNILHNGVWAQDYEDGWMYSTGSGKQYSGINLEQYYARTRPDHDKTGSFISYDDNTHIATFLIPSKSDDITPEGLDVTDPTKPLFGNWNIEAIFTSTTEPTSPGTGDYDGISNIGPFTLYSQLGDGSSPGFGHIGFHAGSKYGDVVLVGGKEPPLANDVSGLDSPILRSISGERGDPNNVWPDRSRLWASSIDSTMTGNEINLNSLAIDTGNWKKYTEPYSKQIGDLALKEDKLRPWDIVWEDSKEASPDGRLYFGGEVKDEKYDVHTQYKFRSEEFIKDHQNPYLFKQPKGEWSHPFIQRSVSDFSSDGRGEGVHAWKKDDYTTENSTRRGMFAAVPRTIDDEIRIGKFMAHPIGIEFITKQYLFHGLNPRKESRLWAPASIFKSLIPGFHARSHGESDFGTVSGALSTIGAALGITTSEATYENTVNTKGEVVKGSTIGRNSLLYLSGQNINDASALIKVHKDWRTTRAHSTGMVPSEGGKMAFDGYVIGGAAEETVKSGNKYVQAGIGFFNWLTGGIFRKDGTIEFGKPRSVLPYLTVSGTEIKPTPKYAPSKRYLVTGNNEFFQGAPKPGSNIMIGTNVDYTYEVTNRTLTQIETKTEVEPREMGYHLTFKRHHEDGSWGESETKDIDLATYEVMKDEHAKKTKAFAAFGEGAFPSETVEKYEIYKYSYGWEDVKTTDDIPFEVGSLGWKAAGSPLARKVVDDTGIYNRGIPASIQEDGVYDQDLYGWGENYAVTPKSSNFTIDSNDRITVRSDLVYTHLSSRADHPAAHGRSPNILTTKFHDISKFQAGKEVGGQRGEGKTTVTAAAADTITETAAVEAKIVGKKTWMIGTRRTPVFASDFLGQSVFHSARTAGISEFAGDEFGNNFKNLSAASGLIKNPNESKGLGVAKYYINGKAEEKYLELKGGHRIGIGTTATAKDELIAISAINYRHPPDQWPSTPKLKIAYGGGLGIKEDVDVTPEATDEAPNPEKVIITANNMSFSVKGIDKTWHDGFSGNEYSSGGKYGNIPSSNQYWPNVLNPKVPEKPKKKAAEEVKTNFLTLSEGVGAPPDNRRFRLGTMGSHLSTSGKDFVEDGERTLKSMIDGSDETWNITSVMNDPPSVSTTPIAIAKTSYIHKHWPSGVVNRFSQAAPGVHHITKTSNVSPKDATEGVFNDSPYGTIILTPTYKDTTTGISVFRDSVFNRNRWGVFASFTNKYGEKFIDGTTAFIPAGKDNNQILWNKDVSGMLPGSLGGGLLNTGVVSEDAEEAIPDDPDTTDVNEGVDAKDAIPYKPGLIGNLLQGQAKIQYTHPPDQWPETGYLNPRGVKGNDGITRFPITFTDRTTGQKVFNTNNNKLIIFKGDLYGPGKLDSGEDSYSKYQKSTGTFVSKLQQYFMTIPTTSYASDIAARYTTIGDDDSLHKQTLKLGVGKFKESLNAAETTAFEEDKSNVDLESQVSAVDQLANKLKEVRPTAKTYPTFLEPGRYSDHAHLGEPGSLVTKVQGFEGFYSGMLHKKENELLRASSFTTTDVDDPTTKTEEQKRTKENKEYVYHNPSAIKGYAVLSYGMIPGASDPNDDRYEHGLRSPSELINKESIFDKKDYKNKEGKNVEDSADEIKAREDGKQRIYSLGQQGLPGIKPTWSSALGGLVKRSDRVVDKVNILPYGGTYGNTTIGAPDTNTELIPFRFRDAINGKWIIFRAILGAITDTVTADWAEEKYVGRPEQVYVYQGAGREVSFAFDIYPTTRQELPVLWEKLNYLVGLCYPSYYSRSGDTSGGDIMSGRMVGPWIYLTIGDMFNNSPGFLTGVTVTTGDETTWETDGTKLPKHITVDCTFKYIGNHQLMTTGKHYDLPGMNGNKAFGNYDTSPQGLTRPDGESIGKDSLKSYVTK